MEKLKMHTPDLTQNHIARIREIFPNCITEAQDESGKLKLAVDFDQLKQELSDSIVEGTQERYHLNWPGKREALLTANAPIAKTLRPCREESVDFDTTKNLFIEGDNLEALKLLQETYLGKVKMIYIDPPYNTGKDFVYKDDFAEEVNSYLLKTNQKDESGNRMIANPESKGRYHSDWLSMIYSRLKLAKNLLTDDGAIFISIDEHEQANLKEVCDEIFGSQNLVACVSVINNMKGRNDKAHIATAHEYLLIYSRGNFVSYGIPLTEDQLAEYKFSDESGNKYALRDLRKRGRPDRREDRPNMFFPIFYHEKTQKLSMNKVSDEWIEITPKRGDLSDGRWRWGKEAVEKNLDILHAKFSSKKNRWDITHRVYLDPTVGQEPDDAEDDDDDNIQRTSKPKSFLWGGDISTDVASREFKKLFPGLNPDYPKSVFYLDKLIHMGSKPGDIVMDFFGGFATTAHSIFRLSCQGLARKFILVQIAEEIDPTNADNKATYDYCKKNGIKTNVAEISKERVRRAALQVRKEFTNAKTNVDLGFRVLKIDTSNMAEVYYTPDKINNGQIDAFIENIKPDRSPEDLLFQVLLDWGIDLTLPITKKTILGKTVFFVNQAQYDLVACFDMGITEELVKELAAEKPLRVVFRDNGFASDAVKINAEQIFKQISPITDMKAI